jgi:hypothetical protein
MLAPMEQTPRAPFRVEVGGVWVDRLGRERASHTDLFLVSAPSPEAAEVAAGQLFAAAAARNGRRLDGERSARALRG